MLLGIYWLVLNIEKQIIINNMSLQITIIWEMWVQGFYVEINTTYFIINWLYTRQKNI